MAEEKKEEKSNVIHIDSKRIDRLKTRGHYFQMYDSFDLLRIKLMYGEGLTPEEGIKLVTLTKYFMEFGHNEQIKIIAKHIHDKFIVKHGL